MVLNKISAWSKFSRKSRGPSAPRRVLLPSAVFGGTSLLWLNKAIGSVWSPVNSLLGFHSPLLALYSHVISRSKFTDHVFAHTNGTHFTHEKGPSTCKMIMPTGPTHIPHTCVLTSCKAAC